MFKVADSAPLCCNPESTVRGPCESTATKYGLHLQQFEHFTRSSYLHYNSRTYIKGSKVKEKEKSPNLDGRAIKSGEYDHAVFRSELREV